MSNKNIITEKLKNINKLIVQNNVSMKKYTTFKVGGEAKIFITPLTIDSLSQALKIISESDYPFFVLGSGSNIIVSDNGYEGIVIYLEKLNKVTVNNNIITAETGLSLSKLANKAKEASLSGLEFSSGIPGSLGGALFMNAGAYGGEMKDVVESVLTLNHKGNVEL